VDAAPVVAMATAIAQSLLPKRREAAISAGCIAVMLVRPPAGEQFCYRTPFSPIRAGGGRMAGRPA